MEVYKGYMLYSNCELIPNLQDILYKKEIICINSELLNFAYINGIDEIKQYIDEQNDYDEQRAISKIIPNGISIGHCMGRQNTEYNPQQYYVIYYGEHNKKSEVVSCIAVPIDTMDTINKNPTVKEDKTMGNVNESYKTIMSMKMLSAIMKDDKQDLGKLFLMQQMMNGETITVTDVIKSKLIKQFDLSDDKELPVEKVMLLQMLDGGSIDLSQLLQYKMMSTFLSGEGGSLLEL